MTENGITYRLDEATQTYLPDWELPEQKPIGKYWLLRLDYLKKHRKATYQAMLLRGTLNAHLSDTDKTAHERLNVMLPRLAKSAGVTEKLKAENPMKWVGLMNTLKAQAEETVLDELIYC
ncbi:MAG: TnpV protein [Ruminococcus sp.]|nr:TnpV protein [Ruminiclostridium sp.]MBP1536649.1 TnpV protein [Ruminococcus sp.]MBP3856410.1 TnpV protein [Ruminiclostridium sp.]